jgi:YrbI family 3-deoxy-D-manno-octulosonate 8-phosphate phosphatase
MRQERPPEFLEVGAAYAMRVNDFRKSGFRFFGKIGMHEMDPMRTLEIDNPEDWKLAEYLLTMLRPAEVAPGAADRLSNLPPVAQLDLTRIKAVVTDFDGVLTDNRVSVDEAGQESVTCNRSDGWGIQCLLESGYRVACISTEKNQIVSKRCEKMKIPCIQGQIDKKTAFDRLCLEWGFAKEEILYVGNDTNDSDCLAMAGAGIIPADAVPAVEEFSDGRTSARGGGGVLREIAAALLVKGAR